MICRTLLKKAVAIMIFYVITVMIGSFCISQSFRLSGVSDMVRVFEDGYKLPALYDSIKLSGIRGEIISGQFVINARKNLSGVQVGVGEMKSSQSGNTLPEASVQWNYVGSIPLTRNTPNQSASALTRQAPARFPEYLKEERQLDIKEKSWQSVWLTVRIPEKAVAGTYTGKVTVESGQETQSLPVKITVYPLTIPSDRHLKIVEWCSTGGFSKYYGISEEYSPAWFAMLRKYADNMVDHRQNSFRVDMDVINIQQAKDGTFSFDFTRFDQIADIFWSTGKMDFMETGFLALRGEKGWSDTHFRWQTFKVKKSETGEVITLQGPEVIPALVSAFEAHIRQKGWLNRTWFHIQDEPAVHNALSWIDFSRFIHKYGPDLIRMDAIETTFLLNDIEIACPKLDHFSTWYDVYNKWAKKGNELWFYTVGIYQGSLYPNKTIDVPLMDSRMMHWLNYKYDATGYLHWGWNQWSNDKPFEDVGMHIGDAWHVYPSKDGVLNSLRWEEMRNGIQDYEYFWMLENRIKTLKDSLGSRFYWISPKQRGKEIAGRVIQSFADRTQDPEVLENAKMILVGELLSFNKSPRIYVQTNPPEGSEFTSGSSVEVFGWAEPGTKITVNRSEIPVSEEGLFLEQFQLSLKNSSITVNAEKDGKTKTIVREFKIHTTDRVTE